MKIQAGMKKANAIPMPAAPKAPAIAPPIAAAFSKGVRGREIGIGGTDVKSEAGNVEDVEEETKADAASEAVGVDCGDGDVDDDVDSVVELAYVPVLTVEASVVEAGV